MMITGVSCIRCKRRFELVIPRGVKFDIRKCGCPEGRNRIALPRDPESVRREREEDRRAAFEAQRTQDRRADHRNTAIALAFKRRGQ